MVERIQVNSSCNFRHIQRYINTERALNTLIKHCTATFPRAHYGLDLTPVNLPRLHHFALSNSSRFQDSVITVYSTSCIVTALTIYDALNHATCSSGKSKHNISICRTVHFQAAQSFPILLKATGMVYL